MEEKEIIWSHSRLNKLLENPAEYFLYYEEGIKPKQEKPALSTGSAVHWGLENNTSDLTEYYNEKGDLLQWNDYSNEQCLAECMVEAFLRNKIDIYKQMLFDKDSNRVLEILDEYHELQLTAEYPSKLFKKPHKFLGIIDLLLLTEKGWILVDYKTSSQDVDWDNYKSQLYKYFDLIKCNFPEFPIWKIAIINLKKTGIRRRKNENDASFKERIKAEYDLNENNLINLHIYHKEEFDEEQIKLHTKDLCEMMDMAQMMINNKMFFVHYSNIVNQYGPSAYYDIFYKTPDNYALYTIKDTIYDEDENDILDNRNCEPIDMLVLDHKDDVLNKFSKFKEEVTLLDQNGTKDEKEIFEALKKKYVTDDKLLKKYMLTYKKGY